MIKSLEIKGFRGIQNLSVKELGQINVIVGKNNCGKTSVLEALFMIIGMSNPLLEINIHKFRDLIQTDGDDLRFIFQDLNFDNELQIKSELSSGEKRTLNIKPIYRDKRTVEKQDDSDESVESISSTSSFGDFVEGLSFKFNRLQKNKKSPTNYEASLYLNRGTTQAKRPKNYKESINGIFVSPITIHHDLTERLEKILVSKKKDTLIAVMQKIEPNIKDIVLGASGLIYIDLGYQNLVPLNIVGDGTRRLLSILISTTFLKGGIILIDEIENGFHFSSLKILCESIINFSISNDVQLFITTHSQEILKYFKRALLNENNKENRSKFYTLAMKKNKKNDTFIYKYDFNKLDFSIEEDIEIR